MNLDKDIEKKLNEQFNKQDFDIQNAWLEDMSSKLDAQNRKSNRKFFFWFFSGALLLCCTSAFLWNNFIHVKNEKATSINTLYEENALTTYEANMFTYTELACEQHEIVQKETEQNSVNNKSNSNSDLNSKNGISKYTSNKEYSHSKKENTLAKNNTYSKTKTQISYTAKNETGELKTNSNLTKILVEEISNKNYISKSSLKSKPLPSTKENITSNTKSDYKKEAKLKSLNNINKSILAENKVAQKPNTKIESKVNSAIINTELTIGNEEKFSLEELSPVSKQDSLEVLISEKTDSVQEKLEEKTTEKKKVNPKKELGLSLALNAGPSFVFRSFKTDETQNEKRTTEESNKVAWNLNLELYKTFKNNLILGTGINITNFGEKIDYASITETLKDTTYQAQAFDYFNLNISKVGQSILYDTSAIIYYDTTSIIKDSIYENGAVQKANGTTNFTYIEIPVFFGYKILDTKKWSLSATTGISAGFLIHSKGSYINTENKLDPALNRDVIFNYLLSAQLNYKVYKNLNLSLAPNFKYSLNNASTYSGTRKRYASFGVNAGLTFDF